MDVAAARLRETRGLLQGVVDGTPDVVYVKDVEGRYLLMNKAGESYVGRPLDGIVGHTDDDLYDPALASAIRDTDRRVMETEDVVAYETTDTAAGSDRVFLTTKGPFRDDSGRVAGLFGISRDITERKRLEEEVKDRAEELARSKTRSSSSSPTSPPTISRSPSGSWPATRSSWPSGTEERSTRTRRSSSTTWWTACAGCRS
jgi:PAS domain S-box-containing protein